MDEVTRFIKEALVFDMFLIYFSLTIIPCLLITSILDFLKLEKYSYAFESFLYENKFIKYLFDNLSEEL